MTASLTMNNQMRLQGNAAFAMYGIFTGALLNVVLDPLLIFALHLGIDGAAWATVVSQMCSFFILVRDFMGVCVKAFYIASKLVPAF